MAVEWEELRYACDGTAMHGRLYRDPGLSGPRPAVLVFPEFFGISDHTYTRAGRLAEEGFLAVACDLHGEAFFSNGVNDELKKRGEQLYTNKEKIKAVGQSALATLSARADVDHDRVAAIGYCFGGLIALELAFAGAPIAAAVAFHPSLEGATTSNASQVRCPLLLCIGTDDPVASSEARAKFEADLKGTGVRWQMNLYGEVKHGFTNAHSGAPPQLVAYDEWADRDSWNAMVALFEEVLR